MGRFIGNCAYPKEVKDFSLKSNMDRFIVSYELAEIRPLPRLKSNMDRFIATVINLKTIAHIGLKSNMDRFIDKSIISAIFVNNI